MSLPLLFAIAFTAALSGALMPGPVLFATVRWSAERGRWVGPAVVAGHAAVELPLMAALVLGLGAVLAQPLFTGIVGLAGAAALLAMGVVMLLAVPDLRLPRPAEAGAAPPAPGYGRIVAAGALTSVSNPYFPLWWGTVGLNFLAHARAFGLAGYAVFYAGHVLADLAWYMAVAESMHHGRRLLSDRAYRWLVGVCAALLVGFALFFGYRGWTFLRAA